MRFTTESATVRDKRIKEEWRKRFALIPFIVGTKNEKNIWVFLEWYEVRGSCGQMEKEYRISTGETFSWTFPPEY